MQTYQALLHRFHVACDDRDTEAFLRRILEPLRCENDADRKVTTYELSRDTHTPAEDRLLVNGAPSARSSPRSSALAQLLERIDHDAERRTGHHLPVLHAAACHRDGRTIVFPAAPNAGKSTLMAHLALAGWTYLSDELVAITHGPVPTALPYPRSIVLDPGSWGLFPTAASSSPQALTARLPRRRYLVPPPPSLPRPDQAFPITDIVLYHWEAASGPAMTDLDPVEALRGLLGSSFSVQHAPRRDLDTLVAVVERARCWRASGGAVREVEEVLLHGLSVR